jgi:hypothetical protein
MKRTATVFISFFLLLSSIFLAQGQVVQGIRWQQNGSYARYSSNTAPEGRIVFANGTKIKYISIDSPAIFEWRIIQTTSTSTQLNLTFSLKGDVKILRVDTPPVPSNIAYYKSIIINIDLQTSETSVENEPIGRISLWTKAIPAVGEKIELFSSPSDCIGGNVTGFRNATFMEKRFKAFDVEVFQLSPFVVAPYVFDQQTGIALTYTLIGPIEILPNSTHTYTFTNGTCYNVTSYARTRLAELLGLESTYTLTLTDTNIDAEEKLQSTFLQVYVIAFAGIFTSLIVTFLVINRRRQTKQRLHRRQR